jgi:hypothetical protein
MHKSVLLESEPSSFKVGNTIKKLKIYKSPVWQNLSKQEAIHYILRSKNSLILFKIRRNCHSNGNNPLYLFVKRVIKSDSSNYRGVSLLITTYKVLCNILASRLTPYVGKNIGDHHCGSDNLYSSETGEKNVNIMGQYIIY